MEELVKRYRTLHKEQRELYIQKDHTSYIYNPQLEKDLAKLESELDEVKQVLVDSGKSEFVTAKTNHVILQLRAICEKLNLNSQNQRILRSQGLVPEAYGIYGYVLIDIKSALEGGNEGISLPIYIHSAESVFDHSRLKALLLTFAGGLITTPPENYIDLETRIDEVRKEIFNLADQD